MTKDATAAVNPSVSIEVDDVDAAYESAVGAGLDIVHPLSDEEWGVRRSSSPTAQRCQRVEPPLGFQRGG